MIVPKYNELAFVSSPPMSRTAKPAIKEFSRYLSANYPDLYDRILQIRPQLLQPGLSGLGAEPSLLSKWGNQLLDVVKVALPIYAQDRVLRTQIKRAEKGLPPLDTSQLTAPAIPIQVQLPKEMQTQATGALAGFKNVAVIAGIGLAGLFLLSAMRPQRGRR